MSCLTPACLEVNKSDQFPNLSRRLGKTVFPFLADLKKLVGDVQKSQQSAGESGNRMRLAHHLADLRIHKTGDLMNITVVRIAANRQLLIQN